MQARWRPKETMDADTMQTGCGMGSDNRTGIVFNGVLSMPEKDLRVDAVRTPAIQNSNVMRFATLGNVLHSGPLDGPEKSLEDLLDNLPDTILVAGSSELQLLRFVPHEYAEIEFSSPRRELSILDKGASLLWMEENSLEVLPPSWVAYNAELNSVLAEFLDSAATATEEQEMQDYASVARIAMVLKLTKAIRDTTTLHDSASSWYLKGNDELSHLCSMQLQTAIGTLTGIMHAAGDTSPDARLDIRDTNRKELELLKLQADDVADKWNDFVDMWLLPYMSRASIVQRVDRGTHSTRYLAPGAAPDGVYLITRDDVRMVGQLPAAGYYDPGQQAILTAWQPIPALSTEVTWAEMASLHMKQLIAALSMGSKLSATLRRRLGGYIAFGYSPPSPGAGRRLRAAVAGVEAPQPYGGLTRYLGIGEHGMDLRSMCAEVSPGEIAAFTECNNSAYSLSMMGSITPDVKRYNTGELNIYPDAEVHKLSVVNEQMKRQIERARGQHKELHEQCRIGGMFEDGVRTLSWGYGKNAMQSQVDEKWVNELFQDYAQTPQHDVYTIPFLAVVRDPYGPRPHVEHSRDPLVGLWAHGDIKDGVAVLTAQNSHAETVYGGASTS